MTTPKQTRTLVDDQRRKYRRKHFKVETQQLGEWAVFDGEFRLSVTHNGYQFSSLAIAPHEAVVIIHAIKDALARYKKEKP